MKPNFALISTYDPFTPVFVYFPSNNNSAFCSVYCPPPLPVQPQAGLDLNTANSVEAF